VDPDSKRLRVSVSDALGRPVRDGGLGRWLESVAPSRARGDVVVALVSDAHIRTLNRTYRRRDRATDVLSFPALSAPSRATKRGPGEPRVPSPEPGAPSLGDIVIATGVARRQAKEAGHSMQAELRVLALHGLLHLLGYDHHDERARARMVRLERRLRRQGGLGAGLIERTSGATHA
jgi:probable rRNA maturation factor